MNWTIRLIDSDHRATLLPDPFTGSPADALAHGRDCLRHHRNCEHLELESESFDPSLKSEISDLQLPARTSFGEASSSPPSRFDHSKMLNDAPLDVRTSSSGIDSSFDIRPSSFPSLLPFDLTQRKTRDGWTLTNHKVLAYCMWYRHWRDAISYAAFSTRGAEILIRISDANSVCRKLVLIVPAAPSYTDGLKFPETNQSPGSLTI